MKRALITGGLGQDGSFLSEYLISLGNYEVYATIRMLPELHENFVKGVHYHFADLKDEASLESVIRKVRPDEIYNLAGQTFVPTSILYPSETIDVNTGGLVRILTIVENLKLKTRIYQASTSEMFGNAMHGKKGVLQLDENSNMHPISPYAVSKHAAHELVDVYRQRGLYVVSGILFNHESERRGPEMVTRKITRHVARWRREWSDGQTLSALKLGAITSKRDWGYAGDYVTAMHAMLQQDTPDDYVIGTGEAHSVAEFLVTAIQEAGLETSYCMQFMESNAPELQRLPELLTLVADNSKAQAVLGWKPKHTFRELVKLMVVHDYNNIISQEELCIQK